MIIKNNLNQETERKIRELEDGYDEWMNSIFTKNLLSMLDAEMQETKIIISSTVIRGKIQENYEFLSELKGRYTSLYKTFFHDINKKKEESNLLQTMINNLKNNEKENE